MSIPLDGGDLVEAVVSIMLGGAVVWWLLHLWVHRRLPPTREPRRTDGPWVMPREHLNRWKRKEGLWPEEDTPG